MTELTQPFILFFFNLRSHRLELFRAIDFEYQVTDNTQYSQIWLEAMASGSTTPAVSVCGWQRTLTVVALALGVAGAAWFAGRW